MALKPDGRGLTVVGDDAQSIYSFRAAEVRNILDFPGAVRRRRPTIVTLDRNYRSTETILAAANAVIGEASERFTKNLWSERKSAERPKLVTVRDEAEQANYVCEEVLEEREAGTALKAQAVLFRASHHSGPLEIELTRRNIPFVKFGGLKFLDAAHVKDVLAVLRFAENPRDRVAGFRVLQLLPGIGPSAAAQRHRGHGRRRSTRRWALAALPAAAARGRRTGRLSSTLFAGLRARSAPGRPISNACGSGTSRTWSASTRTPPCGAPTCCSSSRSPPAIPRASAS